MSNKCPKCHQESLSFEDQNGDILDEPYCFECNDFIYEYKDTEKVAKIFKDSVASFYAYYMFTHEDNYYYHFKSKLNGTYIKLEKPNAR